ncbi:alpha/beta fold hydrolase [Serinibacter arcticus]|uniref:Beta-ketoadipate enol-lactone hydrolase n=1 Tax=Serinibacter arcticus TaxID=1655435 RepID=A0A4Z1DZX1_9MICO|nr:alpha/beta hydrolase [Serinibacter arcticus]TGO04620.1 Beta-ketoadipate enol-lactone hydrolase [Serinibacter arcticus]
MKLHTEHHGSGPETVALVHGLGNDATVWGDLVELAAATGRYTVVTVDLRGHGRSDRARTYALADFADDLVETLPTELHGVVSHSLGGAVVARAVDRLSPARAVYLDPGFRLALPDTGLGGLLVRRARWSIPLFAAARGRGVRTPALSPEAKALERASQERWDRGMALAVLQDVATHPYRPTRQRAESTVILSGDAPYVVPDPLPEQLLAAGWHVVREDSLGHAMALEDPRLTWRLVEAAL